MIKNMKMNFVSLAIAMAVAAVILLFPALSFAQGVEYAQAGVVVMVSRAPATADQQQTYQRDEQYGQQRYGYNSGYGDSYNGGQNRSYVGSTVGGVIGAVAGALAGRHSRVGQMIGTFGGGAIGAAIGNNIDNRHQQQQVAYQHETYAQHQADFEAASRQEAQGDQVIVRLDGGRSVAVFTHNGSQFFAGQKVFLIGNDQIVASR
jgi:outer membrane lipoprotein SlyB